MLCYYAFLMRTVATLLMACFLIMPSGSFAGEKGLTVKGVRYFSYAAFTRIVFEVEAAAPYIVTKAAGGRSLSLTAYDGPFVLKTPLPAIRDGVVSGMEAKEEAGRNIIAIRLDVAAGDVKDFVLRGPDRIVIDIARGIPPASLPQPGKAVVVVLDPGHGGKDTGIVTAQGQEKAAVLELAQAVRRILQKNEGFRVILTREKDQSLSLDERAAAANSAGAVIFVSLHAAAGTGDRVYIQDPDEDLGAQPVQSAGKGYLSFEADAEQQERLWGRQQAAHAKESGLLGRTLARALSGAETAEPAQAPLAGLKAVDAAAVIVEVGMAEDRLKTAGAVAKGIEQSVRENR